MTELIDRARREVVCGRVSVIVPTRNSARTVKRCLESVRGQTFPDIELIVVDNASTDGTVDIAGGLADTVCGLGRERSEQRNIGAALATGEHLLFLDSDQVLEPTVVADAVDVFERDGRVGLLVIPELERGSGFYVRCRALEKRLYLGDAAAEAARVYRATAFSDAGGFDEALTGPEDYDLADRVLAQGWRRARVDAIVWHEEEAIRFSDSFRKKRYYGRALPRYYATRPALARARTTRVSLLKHGGLLLQQPREGLGLVALKCLDALGLALGAASAWWSAWRAPSRS
jgi:arabinofuranan 3-O-arabinosyltransferase